MDNAEITVLCLVYNHENNLRRCLDGFVKQKTNFIFEVLIHDDASIDNSASIIREYEEKFPNIIKPTYQTENQHSRGVNILQSILMPKALGKYFAWCEGDDYWIDENKLQKQYDFLEKNKEFVACVHSALFMDIKEGKQHTFPNLLQDKEYVADEIIKVGGSIFATNSFLARKDIVLSMPDCFKAKGFGDYQLFMNAAMSGRVWCMKDVMSVYNYGMVGSWTERIWNDKEKRIEHFMEMIRMLNAVNEYYEGKYEEAINYKILETEYNIHILSENVEKLKDKKYDIYKKMYRRKSILEWTMTKIPFSKKIIGFLVKLKNINNKGCS